MPKPKRLEEALKRAAKAHGYEPGTKRFKAYVEGTLAKAKQTTKREKNVE